MLNFSSKNKDVSYKHDRIVRVISHFKNGNYSVGTGFLINENRNILTCWHVICGMDLKDLRNTPTFLQSIKQTESEKVDDYFKNITAGIDVELPNGTKVSAILKSYDFYYDLAVLRIPKSTGKLPFFELELKDNLDYSDEITFSGYPSCLGYKILNSPFAVNFGNVSSFPDVEISGGKYNMIQMTSICIGGSSGAPLFKKNCNKVYGVVNGYEYRKWNDIAIFKNNSFFNTQNIQVPISISYGTGFDLLSKKSKIFQILIN